MNFTSETVSSYIRNASLPCRKCFCKPDFIIDNGYQLAAEVYKIVCSNCKNQEREEINPMDPQDPRMRAASRLINHWNERNRLELEWFPDRVIPDQSVLLKWDSQNSLRPSEMRRSST